MTISATCAGCGRQFEAKSPRAKWCTESCRKRVQRGAPLHDEAVARAAEAEKSDLVRSLRRELDDAGRLDTVAGQLAMTLAKQVVIAGVGGIAGLSKQLLQVRAEALRGAPQRDPRGRVVESELDKARRRREAKARAARERGES